MLFREQQGWAAPQGREPSVAARRPGRALASKGLVPQQGEQSRSHDSDQVS